MTSAASTQRRRRAPARWPIWLGSVGAVLTALLALATHTALPVVLDVRPWLIGTGLSAGALLYASRSRPAASRRALMTVLSAGCLTVAALAAYDATLVYRSEDITFANGDLRLEGTLYLPRGDGPFPGIVLVHGSGSQPRDEYRYYARMYAKHGIAALAYDKRGSGGSAGTLRGSTYQMLAADAASAVEALRARPDIDPSRVGIWGLSEGEWTGALAAQQTKPAFLVLISASAMTPAEQVAYETGARVRLAGFTDAEARDATQAYRRVSQFERTGEGRESLNTLLKTASAQPWFDAAAYLESSVPDYARVAAADWFPGWRARMDFDALPVMATLTCPVLVQNGGADPKADGSAASERVRAALAAGGNTQFTGLIYANARHNVVEWRLPFGLPPPVFAPGYLDDQVAWVVQQTRAR